MKKNTIIKKPKVTAFLAALNEEKNIEKTIVECFKIKEYEMEVIVVLDSKTTDNTKSVSEKAGALVVHTGNWRGKGFALRKSLKYANGDYVVQIDADYQFLPRDIPKLIKELQLGADVAIATRYRKGAKVDVGSVTKFRRFGIFFLAMATSLFAGQILTDVLAGFKAFKTSVIKDLDIKVDHYGYEAEEVIKAAQKGYRIVEVPVNYKRRVNGNSNLMPLRHGLLFLETILKVGFKQI